MKITSWHVSGGLLLFGGIALVAISVFVSLHTLADAKVQEEATVAADAACRSQLLKLGSVSESGGQVFVSVSSVEDPRLAIADATGALALCPTRNLIAFCLGVGCRSGAPDGQVSMSFRLAKP